MSTDTRQSLLDKAAFMLRSKGYAAFSYGDLEKAVGIRKASIHHYFPKKEDLGLEIVSSYIKQTATNFENIEHDFPSAFGRLCAFASLFRVARQEDMLPLCGALAAEMAALPDTMQKLTKQYFNIQLDWLEKTIKMGIVNGELSTTCSPRQKAFQVLSFLEGSSFICWAIKDEVDFESYLLKDILGI